LLGVALKTRRAIQSTIDRLWLLSHGAQIHDRESQRGRERRERERKEREAREKGRGRGEVVRTRWYV
jgi:hypothetical protein